MSFNQKMGTITVNGDVYDVEEHSTDYGQRYTIQLYGEDMFDGLEGHCEVEQHDQEHAHPREWCNTGTMAISYRGYNLGRGDDFDISDLDFQVECSKCEGTGESDNWVVGIHATATKLVVGSEEECTEWLEQQDDKEDGHYYIEPFNCEPCEGEGYITLDPVSYFKKEHGARVVVGITIYEHSGITMYPGDVTIPFDTDRWDTSFVGFIFDTPEQVKQTIGEDATDEQIKAALEQEVKTYGSYLEGDVTWYSVIDDETNYNEGCGGFVGDSDECERQMYEDLEQAVIKRIAEESERAYWLAREVVTV